MIFGNYSKDNLIHKLEKEPDIFWKFRAPNSGDEIAMERFMRRKPTTSEILIHELALTFEETNMGAEEMGEPYLDKELPFDIIFDRIQEMPYELLLELSGKLALIAKGWGSSNKEAEQE